MTSIPVVTLYSPVPSSTVELSRVAGFDRIDVSFASDKDFKRFVIMANGGGGHNIGVEVGRGGLGDADTPTHYEIVVDVFEDMQIERLWRLDVYVLGVDGMWSDGTPDEPSSEDGWVRPKDRPPVPEFGENEQAIYFLFGVNENSPNDMAFALTCPGGYYVDWGDGIVDTVASGSRAQHLFDYSSIEVQLDYLGYKMVYIKAYPVNGNITSIVLFTHKHANRPTAATAVFLPQVFEMYLQAPYVTTIAASTSPGTRYHFLEIFDYRGTNSITSFSTFLPHCRNLRRLNIDTSKGTTFQYFLSNCVSFNQTLNIDTSNGTNFANFLLNCAAYNRPLNIDTHKGTAFSYFMSGCSGYNQTLTVDVSNSETAGLGTSFVGTSCYALKGLRLLNMEGLPNNAVTISNSSLDVDALVLLFGDLGDRTDYTAGTITITNVFGAARLTAADRLIATSKNWTIVG